ncbi:uncharacterized protein (DUF305 family) [Actinoplanes octamycinicus]|uniref:Uncharacterized protein (DUF305 family) n=1 Tax=Actinoplanes octamycinicus TaxID=135948 RepID=A0A7W7H586_9ACTN|nr:DUF305 domain-containing protein [Actinoplanes octamycinicus]MBB4744102.1 uncharacterized protein (DUF305 family) [Actinoplanes octamycinicus]GIE56940.1 DUF305 domain-containing protein [Actinoplanes octamycinicus]
MNLRRLAAALVLLVAVVAAVLLRNGDEPAQRAVAAEPAGRPSGVDVHFAQMMIVHHEQAVAMSRTLIAKGAVPERIRLIAEFIVQDQQREIDQTTEWLTAWGEPVAGPATGPAGSGDAGHGMLTAAQLGELDRADARTAPGVFLRLMIEHHRGAITMSRSLLDGPAGNPYLHSLAKHVINEQTAENTAMTALL